MTVNNELKSMWKKLQWPILKYYPDTCTEELRKAMKTARIAGVPVEIRTGHLGNSSQKR
jgi:hypothetical protein